MLDGPARGPACVFCSRRRHKSTVRLAEDDDIYLYYIAGARNTRTNEQRIPGTDWSRKYTPPNRLVSNTFIYVNNFASLTQPLDRALVFRYFAKNTDVSCQRYMFTLFVGKSLMILTLAKRDPVRETSIFGFEHLVRGM